MISAKKLSLLLILFRVPLPKLDTQNNFRPFRRRVRSTISWKLFASFTNRLKHTRLKYLIYVPPLILDIPKFLYHSLSC